MLALEYFTALPWQDERLQTAHNKPRLHGDGGAKMTRGRDVGVRGPGWRKDTDDILRGAAAAFGDVVVWARKPTPNQAD